MESELGTLALHNPKASTQATTRGGKDVQKRDIKVEYRIRVGPNPTPQNGLPPDETTQRLVKALEALVPGAKFSSKPLDKIPDTFEVKMDDSAMKPEDYQPKPEVRQALERVVQDFGSNYPNQGELEKWNTEYADAIEALPQDGRGHEFTYTLVKRALTHNISLYGLNVPGMTQTLPTHPPFSTILWNYQQVSQYSNNPTPEIELAHEFVHQVTSIPGGDGLNEQRVVSFENMVRFEQKHEMRRKYIQVRTVSRRQIYMVDGNLDRYK